MLINHGPNRTEIQLLNLKIFVSYQTPVAMFDKQLKKVFITTTKYSTTTTRHINKWIKYLMENETLRSKEESPNSYGSVSEATLRKLFDLTFAGNKVTLDINEEGEPNINPASEAKLKDRMYYILEE